MHFQAELRRRLSTPLPARIWTRLALLTIGLALALLATACGNPVQSDEPAQAARPHITAVQQLQPADGPSRADQYRATAAAYEAERAGRGAESQAPETTAYSDVFELLRMPAANRIQIPALGIDSPVDEVGTELQDGRLIWQVVENIVGHHRASANPGEEGNVVLTGHVESRSSGNVFLNLGDIQVGAEVTVSSAAGDFVYVVTAVDILHESEIGILGRGYDEKLTLITCVNDGIYDHRIVVTALPVELVASG